MAGDVGEDLRKAGGSFGRFGFRVPQPIAGFGGGNGEGDLDGFTGIGWKCFEAASGAQQGLESNLGGDMKCFVFRLGVITQLVKQFQDA